MRASSFPRSAAPRRAGSLLALALLLASTPPAPAQEVRGRNAAELQLFGGWFAPSAPDLEPVERIDGFGGGYMAGVRLGYASPLPLFVEGEVAYSPVSLDASEGSVNEVDGLFYGGAAGVNLQASPTVQVFLLAGVNAIRWNFADEVVSEREGSYDEVDLAYVFGGGVRTFLTDAIAIRAELRDRFLPDGLSTARRFVSPDLGLEASRDAMHAFELSAGLSFFLGGNGIEDADDDGVPDARDTCPETPEGVLVDASGCAPDADEDGVPNHLDRCPDTPRAARVTEDGCPMDADEDGVPDGLDSCPGTEPDVEVGPDGCAEAAPEPAEPEPEAEAPRDADGDGVPDAEDACPGTPADVEVDDSGCPTDPLERGLLVDERLVLEGMEFASESAVLPPAADDVLEALGPVLLRHPELRIEVQGHTDAVGSAAFNQDLSERRARAVLDELLARFPELDAQRFRVRGYGEERPVASNTTPEGRERNRRIELVVVGEGGG